MITRRGLLVLVGAVVAAVLASPLGLGWPVFIAANLVAAAVLAADWRAARQAVQGLTMVREIEPPFSVGRANPVTLVMRSQSDWPLVVTVADGEPANASLGPLDAVAVLPAHGEEQIAQRLVPRHRGPTRFPACGCRVMGPRGLAFSQRTVVATEVEGVTWPDVLQLRDERLLPAGRRPGGARVARAGDRGREFESLRAYVPGDEYRRIAWKAMARRGQPVVVNLQPERRQSLVLGVEAGRLMAGGGGDGLGKLDRAINACVMLAAAAREFDDAVGALAFDHQPHQALGAAARPGQVRRVVETLAPVEATTYEPDWDRALVALGRLTARRSLVMVFSDVHYVETDESLAVRLGRLARRHVVVFASTVDHELAAEAALPVTDEDSLYRRGTATALLARRRRAVRVLRARGVEALDVAPADLTAATVRLFREMRRQGRV